MFGAAELACPRTTSTRSNRWLGFMRADAVVVHGGVSRHRYRGKLRAQMEQLAAAGQFRECQVGIDHPMTSADPLATLVGLATRPRGGRAQRKRDHPFARPRRPRPPRDWIWLVEERRRQRPPKRTTSSHIRGSSIPTSSCRKSLDVDRREARA